MPLHGRRRRVRVYPPRIGLKAAQPKQSEPSTGLFSTGAFSVHETLGNERPMRKQSTDSAKIQPSDITPYDRYLSRRALLAGGLGLAVAQSVGGLGRSAFAQPAGAPPAGAL